MKLNKRIFYFSTISSICILVIATVLVFAFKNNEIAQYIANILLNILAGLIVLIFTSLFDYFIKRRECLESIMKQCQFFAVEFNRLIYFKEESAETMLEANKKDGDDIDVDPKTRGEIKRSIDTENKKNLEKIIVDYINLSEINLNDFWDLYRDLDFLFDYKNKKKKEFWNEIFNYVSIKINKIREEVYHFKIYKQSNNGNYYVNAHKLNELQKEIFYSERQEWKTENEEVWNKNLSNIKSSYSVDVNIVDKSKTLIFNEITDHLFTMYDKVADIAYYHKNDKE